MEAADARVAGAETRLLSRLDAISAGVAHAAEAGAAGHDALARMDALAPEVEGLRGESVTSDDLDGLRAETSRQITDVVNGLGRLTEQVAQAVRARSSTSMRGWTKCVCPSRPCTAT